MALSDNIVGCFDVRYQYMPVFDINSEFSLQSLVNMDAGIDINVTSLVSPVSIEGNWHSLSQ